MKSVLFEAMIPTVLPSHSDERAEAHNVMFYVFVFGEKRQMSTI